MLKHCCITIVTRSQITSHMPTGVHTRDAFLHNVRFQSKVQAFILFAYFLNLLISIAYTQVASWNNSWTLSGRFLWPRTLHSNQHPALKRKPLLSNAHYHLELVGQSAIKYYDFEFFSQDLTIDSTKEGEPSFIVMSFKGYKKKE